MFQTVCGNNIRAQQHTTVYPNGADSTNQASNHRIVISYYLPANQQNLDEFQQLVSSYLNLYIEKCATLESGDVRLKKSKNETMRDLNKIVVGALDFYQYQPLSFFKSFSKNVAAKLDAIDQLDFSKTQFSAGTTNTESAQRMEQFYLQRELDNLKELARMEVGIYGSANVLVKSTSEVTFIDAATKEKLLIENNAFDKKNPLSIIRVALSDASLATIELDDNTSLNTNWNEANLNNSENKEPGNEFASKVLKLLESNNSKLDGMQKQIDDLRNEQVKLWQQSQDEKNVAMQDQIDGLRQMVMALVGIKTGEPVASLGAGSSLPTVSTLPSKVVNMPGSVSIYFAKSSSILNANSKLALNEVVDILARDAGVNILLTGLADKTGDTSKNLVLSEMRANAVQSFIAESGLPEGRVITTFYGDRESVAENRSDRKVMIEFFTRR